MTTEKYNADAHVNIEQKPYNASLTCITLFHQKFTARCCKIDARSCLPQYFNGPYLLWLLNSGAIANDSFVYTIYKMPIDPKQFHLRKQKQFLFSPPFPHCCTIISFWYFGPFHFFETKVWCNPALYLQTSEGTTVWVVNLSSVFFFYQYVSYAFIVIPMSHLCVPLLLLKLNDYAIPHCNSVFADPDDASRRSWVSESIRHHWRAWFWLFKTCFQRQTLSGNFSHY